MHHGEKYFYKRVLVIWVTLYILSAMISYILVNEQKLQINTFIYLWFPNKI